MGPKELKTDVTIDTQTTDTCFLTLASLTGSTLVAQYYLWQIALALGPGYKYEDS